MNILLGVTGSVAALKTQKLYSELSKIADVRIIATKNAEFFLKGMDIHKYTDKDEWVENYYLGDKVLHIELRQWADMFVIAPLDANTLGKLALGLCDNLLTCTFRAWDWYKPVVLCPAMNTMMWENYPTYHHLQTLSDKFGYGIKRGCKIVRPVEKKLACGEYGMGAMAPIDDIINKVNQCRWKFPLQNCNGVPITSHPGAYGYPRKGYYHTGIDLYTQENEPVFAVEAGHVVKVDQFTGAEVGHPWWNKTHAAMVEGYSGTVNYGEITPVVKVGDLVNKGDLIGYVKPVLPPEKARPDIKGHSTSMLHLELYYNNARSFGDWTNCGKDEMLRDPTPYLLNSINCPNFLTYIVN